MPGRIVRKHPRAFQDLREIAVYLTEHGSEATGFRFVERAEETFEDLLEHPHKGRARPWRSDDLEGLRSYPIRGFKNWLVFYAVQEAGITIVRVLHGARDLDALLEE